MNSYDQIVHDCSGNKDMSPDARKKLLRRKL